MSRNEIDLLKKRTNTTQFYQKHTGAAGSATSGGWAKAGLCPFHEDERKGNFTYHVESGAYKCFACGAKGGDVIKFLMEKDRLSFVKAVEALKCG